MSGIAGLVATSNIVPRLVRGLQQLFMREVLRLPCNVMHRFIGAKVRNRGAGAARNQPCCQGELHRTLYARAMCWRFTRTKTVFRTTSTPEVRAERADTHRPHGKHGTHGTSATHET